MSGLSGRLLRLTKSYLEAAKDRLGEIDAVAQEELTRALNRDDIQAGLASSDDPMVRAQAKLNAARQSSSARQELSPSQEAPEAPHIANQTDPIQTAYKIIGIAPGSDFLTVQSAVNKLRDRCAPSRFAEGSQEQSEARMILQKVEEAYQTLQNALDPGAGRFDKLEL